MNPPRNCFEAFDVPLLQESRVPKRFQYGNGGADLSIDHLGERQRIILMHLLLVARWESAFSQTRKAKRARAGNTTAMTSSTK